MEGAGRDGLGQPARRPGGAHAGGRGGDRGVWNIGLGAAAEQEDQLPAVHRRARV